MKTFPTTLFQTVALTGFSASILLATTPAQAINLINNGSFENSSNDWTVTSGSIDYVNS
jgi:hypothetical protein